MKKTIRNYFMSLLIAFLMLFNLSPVNAFAHASAEAAQSYLPEVTTYTDENKLAKLPNAIPMTVTPRTNGTGVDVYVGNIGVDGLDSVTVTVKATGYSSSKSQTAYVIPVLGKTFSFNFPLIKCNTTYNVTIKVTDGSKSITKTGTGKLTYSETQLQNLGWNKGTFSTIAGSVDYHFNKHGAEVSATNIVTYLTKAGTYRSEIINNINKNNTGIYTITTGTGSIPSKKYKHKTDRRFAILTNSGKQILSFGK